MPKTYIPIATTTLTSTSTNVEFTNIPSGYTDLVLVGYLQNNNNADSNQSVYLQFNGDTGTNYSKTWVSGNGSVAASTRQSSTATAYIGNTHPLTSSGWGSFIYNIMNYSNTTTNKTAIGRVNNTNSATFGSVMLWRNTAAITQINIKIENTANAWSIGSVFTIYGILAA